MLTALLSALVSHGEFAPLADVPFEHAPGRIWMRAALNGQPVDALLDSGASGLFAYEAAAERAQGTKGDAFPVVGSGEGAGTGWNATGLRLTLPGTPIAAPVPFILAPARALPGRPVEVAAGFDFLLRYAVEVDYGAQRLRLFNPWTYRPSPDYHELRVRFVGRRPVVALEARIGDKARSLDVLLDSGAVGGLEITRKAAVREGLDDRFRDTKIEDAPGGIGGPSRVRRIGPVPLRLAGLDLAPDATVVMGERGASGADAEYDAILGDAVLRRFDVAFAYWRGRVYLRPRASQGVRER